MTPNRIPGHRVEPVPEFHESIMSEITCSSVVEPGVEFVDHALIADNREDTDDEGKYCNYAQDDNS